MSVHQFDVPGTILHGGGSRRGLPGLAASLGIKRPLLVTDPGVIALGFADEIGSLLTGEGLDVQTFHEVQPDPADTNVEAGTIAARNHRADAIIALGGGSPIDTAKVIAVRDANPGPLRDYMGLHKILNRGLPLIALPTTAGTGSEATKVAVITDTSAQEKMMMLSTPLLPTAAVVDYEFSLGMPRSLTSAVGVDTLTHGIEAFVSRKANPMTDPLALSCIRLVGEHLVNAWDEPGNAPARQGMMLAATQGGMAFANSSVCLVHGMSRPIGAVFHLPHGLSNAILLPAVTRFSVEANPGRYATVARTLPNCAAIGDSDSSACEQLVDWLEKMNDRLDIPPLRACAKQDDATFEAQVEKMATDALASGSPNNNPRVPSQPEIVTLYREIWESA